MSNWNDLNLDLNALNALNAFDGESICPKTSLYKSFGLLYKKQGYIESPSSF